MFFRRSTPQGPSMQQLEEQRRLNEARANDTQRSLERRQLPTYVQERLQQQVRGELPWTSDLSVNEWLLLKRHQFRPLGLVVGSCYYHVGYSMANSTGSWYSHDLNVQEAALYEGRRLALERLSQEAAALGANAVVSVRIETKRPDYTSHHYEFVAFGTAIRLDDAKLPDTPLLCTVSAQELSKLLAEGTIPVGLAMGVCVHYQYTSRQDLYQVRSWWNQEVPVYTDAIYHTRHRAMQNMWSEARSWGATGILAHDTKLEVMKLDVERSEGDEREDHIVQFIATGTAIASTKAPFPLQVSYALNLADGQKSAKKG